MKVKTAVATHFEHIDGMSAEFEQWHSVASGNTSNTFAEHSMLWMLRINLAIAQQLSVISNSLKEGR